MFGMSRLGRVYYPDGEQSRVPERGRRSAPREYSEETAREIDLEVRKIIDEAIAEVRNILQRGAALEALARLLLEKETVEGDALRQLLEDFYPGPKLVPASVAIAPLNERRDLTGDSEARESLP